MGPALVLAPGFLARILIPGRPEDAGKQKPGDGTPSRGNPCILGVTFFDERHACR
jgi:hypothetical protein